MAFDEGCLPTNFDDVGHFHQKFGLENVTHADSRQAPHLLPYDVYKFRWEFMQEELDEFCKAHLAGDLAESFDALLDLAYVALGTAHLMSLPWQEGWNEVQRANMAKERASDAESSKRHHHFDVIKPEGWTPPDIEGVLARYSS